MSIGHRSNPRLSQRGFSLVELMVALAVGMVLTLAIFGVLATAEGRKRVTTNLNDLEQAGNLAMYQLDQWVRTAGSGFSASAVIEDSAYGCLLRASAKDKQTLPRTEAFPAPFASVDPEPLATASGCEALAVSSPSWCGLVTELGSKMVLGALMM